MTKMIEGALVSRGDYAIVVSRYNEHVTGKLLAGAAATFAERGVAAESQLVVWVPGAWELPVAAAHLARSGKYQAVLCLGAVIRGETTHDQHINQQVSSSLGQLALETGVPVIFGLLTCNTMEQALQRAGGAVGNKGVECAEAALRMADLIGQLRAL